MPSAALQTSVSFIIPVRNASQDLGRCLESIGRTATGTDAEVIVADNGSDDGSADVARAAGARVLEVPGRPVGEVRNIAAAAARGDLLAFVDADHELVIGWLDAALRLLADTDVAAVGSQYQAPADGTWVQRMYNLLRRHQTGVREVTWLPSGNLVVRRTAFEEAGGFDASLEACEDIDLCRRLRLEGGRILASDELRSVHFGDPRTIRELFFGELWRGRNNLRVSLRERLPLRALPSVVLPIVGLGALACVAIGLATWTFGGRALVGAGLALFAALVLLRTWVLLQSSNRPALGTLAQAMVFAAVFDAARALALVSRSSHALRRRS